MEDVALESFPILPKSAALIQIADGDGYLGDFQFHHLLPATMVCLEKDRRVKVLE